MTTESTQTPMEAGPNPAAAGPGQSQGHRRRRRRRKNKSSHAAAPQQQAQQGQPAQQSPKPFTHNPPQGQQGEGGGGGRRKKKKKKFFEGGKPRPEPGNSLAPQGGQGKRKNKQRGPREFVGPMDHSYRAVNGNVADGPASTIQITNGGSNHYPDLFDHTPAPKVKEDAPTRIFCFIEDLFFLAKIQETARKLGVKVEFLKGGDKEAVTRLTGLDELPRLVVFDLNNANAKPLTLIPKFKTKFKKATSIIGFLSHLQGDLKLKATEAGCDTVMPRSAFSQSLPNLLRRYGMEEEEEYVPQPI